MIQDFIHFTIINRLSSFIDLFLLEGNIIKFYIMIKYILFNILQLICKYIVKNLINITNIILLSLYYIDQQNIISIK